jgi:hypothetical protein
MAATPTPADQLATQQNMAAAGGGHPALDIAALKAAAGATNVYRFTANFSMVYGGVGNMVQFRQNLVYVLDAALKTALIANSAPMVQL